MVTSGYTFVLIQVLIEEPGSAATGPTIEVISTEREPLTQSIIFTAVLID